MMDKLNEPVLSLSRFFHQNCPLPCRVAGRFAPENKTSFRLQSQGLSLCCKFSDPAGAAFQSGDWLAVKLLSKEALVYKATEGQLLARPKAGFQSKSFAYEKKGAILQDWFRFLSAVAGFCRAQGMAEAETPGLVECPGTEPHLHPFKSSLITAAGQSKTVYLPTSPEMHLKKLLCQDWTDFFEIKLCARNNENSCFHQPEFRLLEFYRAFYRLEELMKELFQLLVFLHKKGFFKNRPPNPLAYSAQELFKKHLGFALSPKTRAQDLKPLLKKNGLKLENKLEDAFFLLFLHCIEPKLPKNRPVFICDYPPFLRAFARLGPNGWAKRFELYWQGLELANGFYEVIDPQEQKALFEDHIQQRDEPVPPDRELLQLMEEGAMPPVSGVALGLDRLFCLTQGLRDLRSFRLFPF